MLDRSVEQTSYRSMCYFQSSTVSRPVKESKDFEKIPLKPGESSKVEFVLELKYTTSFRMNGLQSCSLDQEHIMSWLVHLLRAIT